MEINQKLFDECTQTYKQQRSIEKQSLSQRENMWSKLEELAAESPIYNSVPHSNDDSGLTSAVPGGNEEGADISDILNYERTERQPSEQVNIAKDKKLNQRVLLPFHLTAY